MALKVKDVNSFVQWMSLLQSLFEQHANGCVWFVKYIIQKASVLE